MWNHPNKDQYMEGYDMMQNQSNLQLDAGPDKYHAGPAELQQRLWWWLRRSCSADTGGPYLGFYFYFNWVWRGIEK